MGGDIGVLEVDPVLVMVTTDFRGRQYLFGATLPFATDASQLTGLHESNTRFSLLMTPEGLDVLPSTRSVSSNLQCSDTIVKVLHKIVWMAHISGQHSDVKACLEIWCEQAVPRLGQRTLPRLNDPWKPMSAIRLKHINIDKSLQNLLHLSPFVQLHRVSLFSEP